MQTDTSATAVMVPLMSGTTRMSVDRDDVCSRLADDSSLDDCTAQTGQYTIGSSNQDTVWRRQTPELDVFPQ